MELIDIMTLQTQQAAELLRPFRQAVVLDAYHRRRVMRPHGHPRLHARPAMAFVGQARRPPAPEAGNDTFDHRAAVTTGAGDMRWVGGAFGVQARHGQHPADLLWGWRQGEGLERVRDAHGENPPSMQYFPQRGIVQRQVPGQGVDRQRRAARDLFNSVLHFVDHGQHRAGVSRISYWQLKGEDKARGGLGENAGFAAERGGTVTLALANRGNGEIVGIEEFTLEQRLALGEAARLGGDLLRGREDRWELSVQACPLTLRQMSRPLYALRCGPRQLHHRLSALQQLRFRLAHHPHKHFALAPALATKAVHELGEVVLEVLRLGLQRRACGRALSGEVRNDLKDFFFAFYRVVASLTPWLPCSLGKVSTTTGAGLTRPASMAAAAWIASSSSITVASMRLRNWAKTAGSTKCPWERSAWTSRIPQAYLTAKSVRSGLQICSSAQCNSCLSNSKANHTRVATGARPRAVGVGKRCAQLPVFSANTVPLHVRETEPESFAGAGERAGEGGRTGY